VYETFDDVAASLPHFMEDVYNAKRRPSALGYVSPVESEEKCAPQMANLMGASPPEGVHSKEGSLCA
jgi:hypothetical protein